MIIRNCTTTQILFDYLVGRRKTEDGRIPSFDFFELFLKLFKPSGKKVDIHNVLNLNDRRFYKEGTFFYNAGILIFG
jgi:hypothetical protein